MSIVTIVNNREKNPTAELATTVLADETKEEVAVEAAKVLKKVFLNKNSSSVDRITAEVCFAKVLKNENISRFIKVIAYCALDDVKAHFEHGWTKGAFYTFKKNKTNNEVFDEAEKLK